MNRLPDRRGRIIHTNKPLSEMGKLAMKTHFSSVAVIGLGLIGSSFAAMYRNAYPDARLVGIDVSEDAVKAAQERGWIDEGHVSSEDLGSVLCGCELVMIATPVPVANEYFRIIAACDFKGVVTDACSTKKIVSRQAQELLRYPEKYIPGHPMAGSEKNGFANSKAHLIENAYYILTPSAKVSEEKINAYRNFVSSLKALPIVLDYRQHDCITGTISHLPHIIASTLVNFVRDTDTKEELMKALAAGGFKDITRIASSSPVMWQQICLKNGKNISHILGQYIEALIQAKLSIDTEDENALYTLFESSRDYRNSMPNTSAGPIKKQFAVYCDIIDETGGIATIATILASNNISIKNIGIIHNREFEEGVLRIEFYDESSSSKASALLKKYRYIVYEV